MKSNANPDKPTREAGIADVVSYCSVQTVMMEQLRRIYKDADRAVARIGAVCLGGGNCCKFDLYDHRLYLTPVELALLVISPRTAVRERNPKRCPYQVGPRCVAYPHRPLGCRIFFCREKKQQFDSLYEQYHREIQALHESYCIPYSYGELTSCLAQLFPNK